MNKIDMEIEAKHIIDNVVCLGALIDLLQRHRQISVKKKHEIHIPLKSICDSAYKILNNRLKKARQGNELLN